MIRLHFTAADLRRIMLAPSPNALFETALSARRVMDGPSNGGRRHAALRQWHRQVGGSRAERAGVLLDLVSQDGFVPDFLLQPSAADFPTAVDLAGRTPTPELAADLGLPEPSRPGGGLVQPSRWTRELADGSAVARRTLVTDLRRYFTSSIAPIWPQVRTAGAADRALRAEMLLRGGIDALLTTLAPTWRWEPPTLHIPSRSTYDIPLCGRGLLLIPSWFATGPLVTYRPDRPTVLVHPVHITEGAAVAPGSALGPLLGHTRAAVLAALGHPASTTALAERVGISLAAASQHATVLRNAGLVHTTRTGIAVLHTLTPLGQALLAGEPPSLRT